jgi:penicillin G amidase
MKRDVVRRLGAGEAIESVCQGTGWTRVDFDNWWQQEAASRAPRCGEQVVTGVQTEASIERDRWGIPHIFAESQYDLWFAFGFAMAQDRLFQMDYLRRKGLGRLAEVLGADGLPLDLVARTVGLNRIAQAEWSRLPVETREVLQAFAAGVTAWIEQCGEQLPIEFDLLDYRPEPWTPVDSLAIESEFRWYLTGRFPVIVMPEMARRVLGEGRLYQEFILGEEDREAIVPPESYRDLQRQLGSDTWSGLTMRPCEEVGLATGDPEGTGSNNWVVAGRHCRSGMPLVASDPHIAFEAVSCWYEAHLCGGGSNVAGMAYVGMPAIMFGRNEQVAWGMTNNICSQRDLYQEQTDPAHPNCFQFAGRWERARELVETIQVKGAESTARTIRFSRNGPVVNEILPLRESQTGPVTLKWLGAYHGGWLTALLGIDRARSVAEFRKALEPWHVPTFNVVVADALGQIAVQSAGRIPLRKTPQRGYRSGSDPDQQWMGLLPFEAMPHAIDPPRGWLALANNRLAGEDYPYPLYGTWISGYRAARIRELIEARLAASVGTASQSGFTCDDFRDMHQDTVSLRAFACVPPLLAALSEMTDASVQAAVKHLQSWDGRVQVDFVAPTLFNVFFTFWSKAVTDVHFEGTAAELLAKQAEGIASRLLADDPYGWFPSGQRVPCIRRVFTDTLAYLTQRFGPDLATWQWGRLHRLPLKHVLSNRGDLGQLLSHGGGPVSGDMTTVCNTGSDPNWLATSGAGYRLIADLATNCLLAVDAQSQSGHPGSPHYSDQLAAWNAGEYHVLPLHPDEVSALVVEKLRLCAGHLAAKR